jgi:hypothetical protein
MSNAGKGVVSVKIFIKERQCGIVFRKGDVICKYEGEF